MRDTTAPRPLWLGAGVPPLSRRSLLRAAGLVVAGASGGSLLAGCGGGGGAAGGGETTLKAAWWGADDRHQRTLKMIDLYQQRHSDVKIAPTYGGLQGFQDKLSTQLAGGAGPDFMQIPDRLSLLSNGSLLELDAHIPDTLDTSKISTTLLDSMKYEDKHYYMPWGLAAGVYFYDTKVFSDAGVAEPKADWTWDDYADLATKITKATPDGVYGSADIWAPAGTGAFAPFEMYLRQRRKSAYTADGQLGFEKADLTEWFQFWDTLRRSEAVTPAKVTAQEAGFETSPLVTGKAALYPINSSIASSLQQLAKNPLGIVNLPNGKGSTALAGDVFGQYINASIVMGVNARSKHPDQAVALMNFFINDPDANKLHLMARGVPVSSEMAALVQPSVSEIEKKMIGVINHIQKSVEGEVITAPAKSSPIGDLMNRSHQDIAFERAAIPQTVDKFFAEAERTLG